MKRFFTILTFIWNHPLASKNRLLAYSKFFSWQISQKIVKRLQRVRLVENSMMLMKKGMTGATGNIYTGLLEFEDMAFVLHVLTSEDVFGDVGANVGVYTILASKNAGAKVVSVEPIPATFEILKQNVFLNNVSGIVTTLSCGVGEEKGTLQFTSSLDTVNHVLSANEQTVNSNVTEVPIDTLDNIFSRQDPVILKIDVEGYEWPVLNGAKKILSSPLLKALIIELNGSRGRYGFSDNTIHELLALHGFYPYKYEPFTRRLKSLNKYGNYNTIYIRDIAWVTSRVQSSKKYKILHQKV